MYTDPPGFASREKEIFLRLDVPVFEQIIQVANTGSTSFVDPLGRQRELFALQTATKAQSRAVLLSPLGRARTRKGNLLPARAIADSPVKKKNVIHMRWSVIKKDQHRERDSRQKKQSV